MKRATESSTMFLAAYILLLTPTAWGQVPPPWGSKAGVLLDHPAAVNLRAIIDTATASVPPRIMTASGLAGVKGGIQVKVVAPGEHNLLLPLPQSADSQAPVAYSITCTPMTALSECRILERPEGNVFLNLRLNAEAGQEVKVEWSAVVLICGRSLATNQTSPDDLLAATACAQSGDKQVVELANKLWPVSGNVEQYAKAIQAYIRDLKQKRQPRSLDAVGMLESGANWICTANANLAAALMRARHLPCRSIAVIPPISRRLEMHRVVEYFDHDKWISFDPSMLQTDVPLKPWHEIIMAKTTVADEQISMKPRMASVLGCPFGQEVELSAGLTLSGNEFYWTVAAPLSQFEVSDEAARLTVDAWKSFLKTGILSSGCTNAATATSLNQYLSALKASR